MPTLDDEGLKLAQAGAKITRLREEISSLQAELSAAEAAFDESARRYGAQQSKTVDRSPPRLSLATENFEARPDSVAPPSVQAEQEPWKDARLSNPKRVQAFFEAHPKKTVTARDLVSEGIDEPLTNLNSVLYREYKKGVLQRLGQGVYALDRQEPTEENSA